MTVDILLFALFLGFVRWVTTSPTTRATGRAMYQLRPVTRLSATKHTRLEIAAVFIDLDEIDNLVVHVARY